MSALDKIKKSLSNGDVEETGSFQDKRTAFINYLYNHKWLIDKECELLEKKKDPKSQGAFNEKQRGWALIDTGVDILKKMYQ